MDFNRLFSKGDGRQYGDEQKPEVINIVQDALTRIDGEVNNSYRDLVPQHWQRFVDELIAAAERYQHHFGHSQLFEETIARYWVACHRTFSELARIAGFSEVRDSLNRSSTTGHAVMVACLTGNLSYLFFVVASGRRRRERSYLKYRTFFLRERPEVQDFAIKGSVYIIAPPAINERLEVAYCEGASKSLLRTSPLVSIYHLPFSHPNRRTWLNGSMQEASMYLHQYLETDISHWQEGR